MFDSHAARRTPRPIFNPPEARMAATILVMLALAVVYWFPIRRWFARWGRRRAISFSQRTRARTRGVWQFGPYPIDRDRTRLVSRGTERFPRGAGACMEPAAFVMTRRMLLGVKERAEAMRKRARAARSLPRSSAVTTHP